MSSRRTMTPSDSEDAKPGTDTSSSAAAGGDDKRKARVIDGTAEDVTDAPTATGGGSAMTYAAPVVAFFVGAALLAAVLWQTGMINGMTGVGPVASGDVAGRLDAADTRIAALLRDVERLGGELRAAQDARDTFNEQLQQVEGQVATATGTETDGLARAEDLNAALRLITEIDGRLVDAEAGVSVAQTAVQPDQIEALQAVIAGLETRLAVTEAANQSAQAAERRVAAMEAGVAAIGAQQGTQATELGSVRTEIGALGARADAVRETLAAHAARIDALADGSAALDARLSAVETRVDRPEAARRAALGIALASLSGAANEGGAFAEELAAVDALAPGAEQVAALQGVAQTGVADANTLLRQLQPAARAALKAEAAGAQDGFWQRLSGNALSLVTVRRTGDIEGDSVEAKLARAEIALGDGKVADAVALVESIEGPAAAELAGWLDAARARASVNALIGDMRRLLLTDLARAHSPAAETGPAAGTGPAAKTGSAAE